MLTRTVLLKRDKISIHIRVQVSCTRIEQFRQMDAFDFRTMNHILAWLPIPYRFSSDHFSIIKHILSWMRHANYNQFYFFHANLCEWVEQSPLMFFSSLQSNNNKQTTNYRCRISKLISREIETNWRFILKVRSLTILMDFYF